MAILIELQNQIAELNNKWQHTIDTVKGIKMFDDLKDIENEIEYIQLLISEGEYEPDAVIEADFDISPAIADDDYDYDFDNYDFGTDDTVTIDVTATVDTVPQLSLPVTIDVTLAPTIEENTMDTFDYSTLTYSQLQAEVRDIRNSGIDTPKLNSKKQVLVDFLTNWFTAIDAEDDDYESDVDTTVSSSESWLDEAYISIPSDEPTLADNAIADDLDTASWLDDWQPDQDVKPVVKVKPAQRFNTFLDFLKWIVQYIYTGYRGIAIA